MDEGYVVSGRPHICCSSDAPGLVFSSWTIDCDLVSVQTMALYSGSPVSLSQRTVVSRWLVMPMPLMLLRE